MTGCYDDDELSVEERQKLILKKIPRDFAKWVRDPTTYSDRKLRKLLHHMRKLDIDIAPYKDTIGKLKDLMIVSHIMRQ
jgi:hypothetical protein